jgi:putative restriction endonuclease
MPGIFVHRRDTHYADEPEQRYQFPKSYLSRASQFAGDWAVYYEPVKAGGRGYYAVARVERIVPDPTDRDMYLALIEPGSYLDFATPVPFRNAGGLIEQGLLNEAGAISGRAQAAVRPLSARDFAAIINRGLGDEDVLPRDVLPDALLPGVAEERTPFVFEQERVRVESPTSRVVRDRVFRSGVIAAYDARCAITGLKFINGGGRAEVEAAHIRPVEYQGPDSINNGLALSGTAHWMFDRGLIGLGDDLSILVSRHVNDVESVERILPPSRRALSPNDPALAPHPRFLAWHRERVFKGL